jgi:hypothetical protein
LYAHLLLLLLLPPAAAADIKTMRNLSNM